jgi:ABC-type glycerol-3-phosphate transport system substrate-binding protein
MDILSGDGPDIILINPNFFESINKLSSNGVFCDLNELIKKDSEFKIADYNEKVLKAFEQDGKRFIIPLRYAANICIASKEALQRNDLKIDPSNWDYNELVKVSDKYVSANKENKKYFLFPHFGIRDLIKGSGLSFVDYKNKKSTFNSVEFIEILDIYKRLYPAICPEEEEKRRSVDNILKNDFFIMHVDQFACPSDLFSYHSLYKSIGEEMEIFPFPVLSKENKFVSSYVDAAVAVNSQCKNKQEAFNFVKVLMSREIQEMAYKHGNMNSLSGAPVNKKAYDSDFEFFTGGYEKDTNLYFKMGIRDYEFSPDPLPKAYKPKMDNILSKVNRAEMPEEEIFNIIKEEMQGFLDGKKTATQTAKAIDDKVNLYLNE